MGTSNLFICCSGVRNSRGVPTTQTRLIFDLIYTRSTVPEGIEGLSDDQKRTPYPNVRVQDDKRRTPHNKSGKKLTFNIF